MDFALSDERRMLKETADRYLTDHYSIETRHSAAAMEGGFDPAQWKQVADLGLVGALFPPEVGGYGGTGEDIALVFESLGRALVVEPFLPTLMGGTAMILADQSRGGAMMEGVIDGSTTLALAHGEPNSRYSLSHVETRAEDSSGWTITGRKSVVLNGDTADHLIVSARVSGDIASSEGISLFVVPKRAAGMEMRDYGTIEGGHACEISFNNTPAEPIGTQGNAVAIIEATVARGVLGLCAEALGIMDICKDMTLDYLKTRTQFGRPIGKFQVIQHRMVDMVLEIEQARSAVMLAAACLDGARRDRERTVSAAKNLIGRVGRLVAEESIQLHGGIAMTWDYALPHYAKRLVMIDHLCGDTDHHLVRFQEMSRLPA